MRQIAKNRNLRLILRHFWHKIYALRKLLVQYEDFSCENSSREKHFFGTFTSKKKTFCALFQVQLVKQIETLLTQPNKGNRHEDFSYSKNSTTHDSRKFSIKDSKNKPFKGIFAEKSMHFTKYEKFSCDFSFIPEKIPCRHEKVRILITAGIEILRFLAVCWAIIHHRIRPETMRG